jgi:hypothetical protein
MKAFPNENYGSAIFDGMDLRDYFASHAMQALVSIPKLGMNSFNEYAVCAYKYADAMMEARNDDK